jgi:hypothetical protein
LALVLGWTCGTALGANWTNSASLGSWNVAANWNPTDVPDTDTELAYLTNGLSAGPYTCRVDNAMYPGGLTCGGMKINNHQANTVLGCTRVLVAEGVTMSVGSPANPTNLLVSAAGIFFTNGNLTVYGETAGTAIEIDKCPYAWPWNAEFLNTSILVPNGITGLFVHVAGGVTPPYRRGAKMRMTDGNLTLTNSAGTSMLRIGHGEGTTNDVDYLPTLSLTRMKLTANRVSLGGGRFVFDGTGASGASVISSNLDIGGSGMKGGFVQLLSGDLTIGGNVTASSHGAGESGLRLSLVVSGATVAVRGSVNWTGGGNNVNDMQGPTYIDLYRGSLNVGGALNLGTGYGTYPNTEKSCLRIFGGNLTVSNTLALGSSIYNCPAFLEMSGGSAWASNLVVGKAGANDGYYNQTGGTNTVATTITLQTTNANYATKRFVVASNATLVLKGNGFVKSGTTAWSPVLLVDSNLSFMGTTVYDPVGVTVQTNFAFGQDIGKDYAGLTALGSAGTWDLSALDGDEKVRVRPSGNFATNAVYINRITGLAAGTAAARIESAVNLYYNSRGSSLGEGLNIALTGGGHLIALPLPSSQTLMSVR